jgi:hypothetical protein
LIVLRIIVALVSIVGVAGVLLSVLRTVVLPRAVPARLARVTFLAVRGLLLLRLRLGRSDYETRDRVFALQAPLGLFAQLVTWSVLIFLYFGAIFWALSPQGPTQTNIVQSLELSGSSMVTLGIDHPQGLVRHLVAFSAAGVGLTLLALVITYLPSLYGAFSRREALITKLVVRAGSPPSGVSLLRRTWELHGFEQLDEVWDGWENWFIEVGETHTTFPQLGFFRSPNPRNHWVLAAEAVLDGAALFMTTCDVTQQSRSEMCVDAGVNALVAIAEFLGIPRRPPEPEAEAEINLPRDLFDQGRRELADVGVPVADDGERAWGEFRRVRRRYEPLIAVLGRMTDAPRSEWSSWSDDVPRHSPPLIRIHGR